MARIRTIKPEIWSDPDFVERSSNARLLFVAALNFASDYGVMADKPLQVKMQCFPGDNVDIDALIAELVDAGLWLRRVAPDGAPVLVIRTFTAHQKVDKPTKGRWGNPAEWPNGQEFDEHSPNDSTNTPRSLVERSTTEGKGMEGKGSTRDNPPNPPPTDGGTTEADQPENPLQLHCLRPSCNQPPGSPCIDRSGNPRPPHSIRCTDRIFTRIVAQDSSPLTVADTPNGTPACDCDECDGLGFVFTAEDLVDFCPNRTRKPQGHLT